MRHTYYALWLTLIFIGNTQADDEEKPGDADVCKGKYVKVVASKPDVLECIEAWGTPDESHRKLKLAGALARNTYCPKLGERCAYTWSDLKCGDVIEVRQGSDYGAVMAFTILERPGGAVPPSRMVRTINPRLLAHHQAANGIQFIEFVSREGQKLWLYGIVKALKPQIFEGLNTFVTKNFYWKVHGETPARRKLSQADLDRLRENDEHNKVMREEAAQMLAEMLKTREPAKTDGGLKAKPMVIVPTKK
jgi:hypothetical protein